jgi:hypothetical protein
MAAWRSSDNTAAPNGELSGNTKATGRLNSQMQTRLRGLSSACGIAMHATAAEVAR